MPGAGGLDGIHHPAGNIRCLTAQLRRTPAPCEHIRLFPALRQADSR